MILTPSPRERDSATAYREYNSVFTRKLLSPSSCSSSCHLVHALSPGMTMEMAGTLMGATVHGLLVSSAHGSRRCEDPVLAGSTAVSPDVVSVRGTQGPLCRVNSFLQGCSSVRSSLGGAAHPFPTSLAKLISPNTYQVLHQACLEEKEGGKEGETERGHKPCSSVVEHLTSMHEALMDSITRHGQNQPNSPSKKHK